MGPLFALRTFAEYNGTYIYAKKRRQIRWLQTTCLKNNFWKGTRARCQMPDLDENDLLDRAMYKDERLKLGQFQPRYLAKGRRTTGLKRTGRGVRRVFRGKKQRKMTGAVILKRRQKRLEKKGSSNGQLLRSSAWVWTRLMKKRRLVKKIQGQRKRGEEDMEPDPDADEEPMPADMMKRIHRKRLHRGKKGKRVLILKAPINRKTKHKRKEKVVREVPMDGVEGSKKTTTGTSKKSKKSSAVKKKAP